MSSEHAPQYRRRRRWPMLVLLALLLGGTTYVWVQVLKPTAAEAAGCNPPTERTDTSSSAARSTTAATTTATGTTGTTGASTSAVETTLGTFTSPQSLADIRPANPAAVPMRVRNASGVMGQAETVTDTLRAAGFSSIRQPENDPLYSDFNLHCYGEIRYGYAGLAQARTALMIAPCAQLVRDDRGDDSVDLVLGKRYQVAPIPDKVKKQLQRLTNAAAAPPVSEGHTVSVRSLPPIPPLPEPTNCPS